MVLFINVLYLLSKEAIKKACKLHVHLSAEGYQSWGNCFLKGTFTLFMCLLQVLLRCLIK